MAVPLLPSRDNDRAAEGMGIPIFKYKLLSFAISSFYAGFAGALWTHYIASVTPEPFTLFMSVEYIAMIIIGGLGSIPGAVFGAIFITVLNEILSGATTFFMNLGAISKYALQIAPSVSSSLDWPLCYSSSLSPKVWQRYGALSGQASGCGRFRINPPPPPWRLCRHWWRLDSNGTSSQVPTELFEGIMEDSILLQLNNISVVYSDVIQVLKGVSLVVRKQQIVSLLGSNGAGKTSILKAISGLLKPENGRVTEGSIIYEGHNIHNSSPEQITRLGIIQVLEGRHHLSI